MSKAGETFAIDSDAYRAARPKYPLELYDWILDNTAGRDAAWDCATGNGQAAVHLAPYFARVCASDLSPEQLQQAISAANLDYRVAAAEDSGYSDRAFDLVTVAQALHWFDMATFWPEVRRVARPGAFFCAWGYAWFSSTPEADQTLVQPLRKLIRPYWAENNRLLWNGYQIADIAFPFVPKRPPPLMIKLMWRPDELLAYMQTWSAFKRAYSDKAVRPAIDRLIDNSLSRLPAEQTIPISMPLAIIAGQVTPA